LKKVPTPVAEQSIDSGAVVLSRNILPSRLWGIALISGICLAIFFWGLGSVPFYDKGEPREGLVVWEIWTTGNWILPLRAGVDIPSKPPLFHWIGALASKAMGRLDEFTVRFPSALLATVGVLLTYLVGAHLWGQGAGVAAAIALATSFEWWRAATSARVDMTLTLFMLLSFLYFLFLYRAGGGKGKAFIFAVLLGLSTLAKGPVGAILPILTVFVFLWCRHDLAFLKRLHPALSVSAFVAVAGSWYLLALWQGGERFFLRQIVHENLLRPLGGIGHHQPFYYFIPALFLNMAPWSLFFPLLALFVYQNRRRLAEEELLYPLVWFGTVFIVLSASVGKRTVYILPLYPAVALLFGAWWEKVRRGEFPRPGLVRLTTLLSAVPLLLFSAFLTAQLAGWDLLTQINPLLEAKDRAMLPHFASVTGDHSIEVSFYAGLCGLVGLGLLLAAWKKAWDSVLTFLAAVMVVFFFLVQNTFHRAIAEKSAFKSFMIRVQQQIGDRAPLVLYSGNYAITFYANMFFDAYQDEVGQLKPPLFLLMWEKEWEKMRGRAGLTMLDISEGRAIDGGQRLVLVAAGEGARLPKRTGPAEPSGES
jgi:4-amino-4-deoxy-L-arabinose transferase-like glycosyltransferase